MKEQTCLIIKPDGVCKRLIGKVIDRLERKGLQLVGLKMLKPPRRRLESFYAVHKGKPFFKPFLSFMTKAPLVVTAWEGKNAVLLVRRLIGSTDSRQALPSTLRGQFGTDNRRNLVHSSDSPANARKEIKHFFKAQEIQRYDKDDWED